MSNTINLAIQILPMNVATSDAYQAIDAAIELVKSSGLTYTVCPFETVIEGAYDEVMELVGKMKDTVLNKNINHVIVNIKMQIVKDDNVHISDKMKNYIPS